jgi:hypothetical protein
MIRVIAVRYTFKVYKCIKESSDFIKTRLTLIRHPVSSLETPIAIRIKLSVQNLLALNSTLLAFFFVSFALHVVENSSVCARDNNA